MVQKPKCTRMKYLNYLLNLHSFFSTECYVIKGVCLKVKREPSVAFSLKVYVSKTKNKVDNKKVVLTIIEVH